VKHGVESLKKGHRTGLVVREFCVTGAIREGEWIHRDGTMFIGHDLIDEAAALWPDAKVVKPVGIISDVPELVN